jgi:hypothetical protein
MSHNTLDTIDPVYDAICHSLKKAYEFAVVRAEMSAVNEDSPASTRPTAYPASSETVRCAA